MGLSEPKSRVMYAADPRNLNWSQDKSRFGFKMLEKMGWSEGKGLGLNEDGDKDHVKIKLKTNQFGIGADQKTIRNWLANTDGFSALLDRLNSQPESEASEAVTPEETLEAATPVECETPVSEEPRQSRLTHRAKFRRMKMMATRDARGLQEILGVRSSLPTPESQSAESSTNVETGVSVSEYFAKKMADNPMLAAVYGTSVVSSIEKEVDVDVVSGKKRKSRDSDDSKDQKSKKEKEKKEKKVKKDKKDKKEKKEEKSKDKNDKKEKKVKKDKKEKRDKKEKSKKSK
ncbi:hypothetical protein GGH96_005854 [Coemansia sp. RSA 1972]|nr:hypothetical protein GGH96_005854 [Coemansia sp. RSA 1972]